MLSAQELLTNDESSMICKALDEISTKFVKKAFELDDSCEDIHMLVEKLLIDKIGDIGKKLHAGRSRNDQVATILRMYARDVGTNIENLLDSLISTLSSLANKHVKDTMPGYTHLQQAQPILGKYFGAYLSMFKRDKSCIIDWKKRTNFLPLGAAALVGSTLPLDREKVAKKLGFDGIIENTLDAVSDRDFVIEFCNVASMIMVHLSRISEDIVVWTTQEFNFVVLDDAFATGSSLMPNKKNPDIPELIRGKSGRVFGHLISIMTIMKGLPLAYNKDMQEDKEVLFDTVNTVVSCLEIITPFLKSIHFNTDVMKKSAKSGYLDATEILESLVIKGIPFRDAHHQVGKWVAEAMEKDLSLEALLKNKNALK